MFITEATLFSESGVMVSQDPASSRRLTTMCARCFQSTWSKIFSTA